MSLKILSCNVCGLGDNTKRKKMFHFLKEHETDVVLMQETHSSKKTQKIWRNQWGANILFSHAETNAQGIAILFKRGLDIKIEKVDEIIPGRLLNVNILFNEQKIALFNVYTLNEQDTQFIEKLFQKCESIECDHMIVGGDFNVALDKIDRFPNENYKQTSKAEFITQYLEENSWVDIWRLSHPETKQFTWSHRKPVTMSRIDMFLAPVCTTAIVKKCEIIPSILTDHSFIVIEIEIEKFTRGKGLLEI